MSRYHRVTCRTNPRRNAMKPQYLRIIAPPTNHPATSKEVLDRKPAAGYIPRGGECVPEKFNHSGSA